MYGRDLTIGLGNVADLDLYIKENKHYYDAFVYGFAADKNLSFQSVMKLMASLEMKLLFYVRMRQIYHTVEADIELRSIKYVQFQVKHSFTNSAELSMRKLIKLAPIAHSLKNEILFSIQSRASVPEVSMAAKLSMPFQLLFYTRIPEMYSAVKTNIELLMHKALKSAPLSGAIKGNAEFHTRKVTKPAMELIAFQPDMNMVLQSFAKLQTPSIAFDDSEGLRLGLVHARRISDIEDLSVSQIENITLNELQYEII